MDAEDDHQGEQREHHHFRDPLHAVLDAAAADREAEHDVDRHPDHHELRVAQHAAEHAADFVCGHARREGAGEELPEVAEHPAGDRGVVHHQHVVAQHAQPAVDVPFGAGLLQRLVGFDHALAAAAANREFHGHDGDAHDDEEQQIEDDEDAAAVRAGDVGEFPYVADTDGAACADEQEAKSRFKIFSFHTKYR